MTDFSQVNFKVNLNISVVKWYVSIILIFISRPHVSGSFENTTFLSGLDSSPHEDCVFSNRKRSFSKTFSRADLFENADFLFPRGRVKTELFENADVTASIYHPSEHALCSLGITRGHFVCLFSFIEVRMSNIVIEYRISLSNSEF